MRAKGSNQNRICAFTVFNSFSKIICWIVGFGDKLRGEKGEREKFDSPNLSTPVLLFFFCPPLLKCFECFEPSAVLSQHVYGYAGFTFFEDLAEVCHVKFSRFSLLVCCLARFEEFAYEFELD